MANSRRASGAPVKGARGESSSGFGALMLPLRRTSTDTRLPVSRSSAGKLARSRNQSRTAPATSSAPVGTRSGRHALCGAGLLRPAPWSRRWRAARRRRPRQRSRGASSRPPRRGRARALDHRDAPQRAVPRQLLARDASHDLVELPLCARCGSDLAPNVVGDVEVGVLDPQRVVQAQRHGDDAPAKRREQVQPALELCAVRARSSAAPRVARWCGQTGDGIVVLLSDQRNRRRRRRFVHALDHVVGDGGGLRPRLKVSRFSPQGHRNVRVDCHTPSVLFGHGIERSFCSRGGWRPRAARRGSRAGRALSGSGGAGGGAARRLGRVRAGGGAAAGPVRRTGGALDRR